MLPAKEHPYLHADNGISKGSELAFTLPDHYGQMHQLNAGTRHLICVFSKASANTVKTFLKQQPRGYLSQNKSFFIVDMEPIPSLIRTLFVLPAFKKAPYKALLIYEKKLAEVLQGGQKREKILIIDLKKRVIQRVHYIESEKQLRNILDEKK